MHLVRSTTALLGLAFCLAAQFFPAAAQENAVERPHVSLRLAAAASEAPDGPEPWAALELHLDPGWKIYWRSPGEAGIPTTIDWSRSENVTTAETRWPLPKRARIWNVDTVGYGGVVLFPAALALVDPAAPTVLRVRVTYGVCREICIPGDASLALEVKASDWTAPEWAARIRAALAKVPDRGNEAAFRLGRIAFDDGRLRIEAEAAAPLVSPDLLIEGPPRARFGEPVAILGADRRQVGFELWAKGLVPGTSELVLTFIENGRGFERRAVVPGR